MSEHPFGPFSGVDLLDADVTQMKICCPKCKSENFRAYTNEYGLFRSCYECKNEWAGGIPGYLPDTDGGYSTPSGVAAPDEDLPVQPYLGPEINHYGDDF